MQSAVPMKDWRFLGCTTEYENAKIMLFGAPFDGTASYRPGSRFAPQAIRGESYGIETWSPYCGRDLEDALVADIGDIDIPIGNTAESLRMVSELAGQIVMGGKKPLMMGGEHLISVPAIRAAWQKHQDLAVLHFDAHTDLREQYLGEKLSHSSAIRRAHDFLGDGAIWQFGIRSGTGEEFAWAAEGHTCLNLHTLDKVSDAVQAVGGRPVYLTIDLDVLDPSEFPGTGTPEAGGVSYTSLMKAFDAMRGLNIIAADVVELAPNLDPSGISTALACKVIREVALLIG